MVNPFRAALLTAVAVAALGAGSLQAEEPATQPVSDRAITADLQKPKGPFSRMYNFCVGAGRANEGLRADWQEQLAEVHKQCGFRYVRMHGIFCDDMGVYKEKNGTPEYNWQYIDSLYDAMLRRGVRPFVELSFCPRALASGDKTIFWWRGNVTPPKDPQKWADLVKAFVTHLRDRYGDEEVRTWYFEVWNEPNLSAFFNGTQQQYFDLYANTAMAIKAVSPAYKVGGPATAGCAWVPEFIAYCSKNHVPVDFISTHTYCVRSGFLDADNTAGTVFSDDPTAIYREVRQVKKQITDSTMPHLELHFTEWSSSYTPSDPIHDAYHSAAFILDKIKNIGDAANSMSYWTFTDIFEEAGPRFTPFHGGFGLLNYQGIRKPSFYAYQFLNRLGGTELENADPGSFVCTDSKGGIQALLWDFTITMPRKSIDQVYYKQDLPSPLKQNVSLHLMHVPDGRYALTLTRVGYRENDAYDAYRSLGSPNQLSRSQVAYLKSASDGQPATRRVVDVKGGEFQEKLPLHENEVVFVQMKRL